MVGAILDHVTPPKYAAAQGAFVVGCYISEFSFFNFLTFFEMHIIPPHSCALCGTVVVN